MIALAGCQSLIINNADKQVYRAIEERQREALSLCAAYPGYTKDKIARKLGIANSTLRNLLSDSYRRLIVSNLAAALIKARQLGLITPLDPEVKN